MKRRKTESAESWKARVSQNLPPGKNFKTAGPSEWMVARYKTTHPRLTKRLDFSAAAPVRGAAGHARLVDAARPGETFSQWANRKPLRQTVVIGHQKQKAVAAFVTAHELRHIADFRHKTNLQITRHVGLQKLFVPYGFRPEEWRANFAGAKAAAKVLGKEVGASPKATVRLGRLLKGAVAAQGLILGGAGSAVRTAPVVATAILYKRHLRKKAALAAA